MHIWGLERDQRMQAWAQVSVGVMEILSSVMAAESDTALNRLNMSSKCALFSGWILKDR